MSSCDLLPIIMIHKDLDNLNWICTENEKGEIESVLINRKTKDPPKIDIIANKAELLRLKKIFEINGWVKGYIPNINILMDGEIQQEVKVNSY